MVTASFGVHAHLGELLKQPRRKRVTPLGVPTPLWQRRGIFTAKLLRAGCRGWGAEAVKRRWMPCNRRGAVLDGEGTAKGIWPETG